MSGGTRDVFVECSDLVTKLENATLQPDSFATIATLLEALRATLVSFPALSCEEQAHRVCKLVYSVWNCAVKVAALKIDAVIIAKIRHLACDYLSFAILAIDKPSESTLVTQFKFLGLTGKSWADAKNYDLSQRCFVSALEVFELLSFSSLIEMEVWEKLRELHQCPSLTALTTRKSILFSIYCWRAETAWSMQQKEVTYNLYTRAKELLTDLPAEAEYLAAMCFNLGLSNTEKKDFPEAVRWLQVRFTEIKYSINVFRIGISGRYQINSRQLDYSLLVVNESTAPKNVERQARTLRLLAEAYLESENFEKALNSILASNSIVDTPIGRLTLIRCYLSLHNSEFAEKEAITFTQQSSCTPDLDPSKCCPSAFSALLISYLEVLVMPPVRDYSTTKALFQEVLAGNFAQQLEPNVFIHMAHLSWDIGASYFQDKDYHLCIEWLSWAAKLWSYSDDNKTSLARCLRVQGQCNLQLKNYTEAVRVVQESLKHDSSQISAHYVLFAAQLHLRDLLRCKEELKIICENFAGSELWQGCVELCAQTAFEMEELEVAAGALESLMCNYHPDSSVPGHAAILTRSLVKILAKNDFGSATALNTTADLIPVVQLVKISHHIKTLCDWISKFGAQVVFGSTVEEIQWFNSFSWNMGCCAISRTEFDHALALFKSAWTFSTLLGTTIQSLDMQHKSLLVIRSSVFFFLFKDSKMAIGAMFEKLDRLHSSSSALEEPLRETLSMIETCKNVCNQMQTLTPAALQIQKAFPLLHLMEFKARSYFNKSDPTVLMGLLRAAEKIPGMTGNIILHIASICNDGPSTNLTLCQEALRLALSLNIPARFDIPYFLSHANLRFLITLQFSRDATEVFFTEILQILHGLQRGEYPATELQWLLATAQNNAVYYHRVHDTTKAEQWMGRALSLVRFLPDTQRAIYEPDLQHAYTALLGEKATVTHSS
ncbi:hypothetical protein Pelo_65 [Pelomyxa schiedti]|nr:hypothetical protein Pelo_65 [Pelomyxa schiedti]